MTRINLILFFSIVVMSLSVVTSQHKARKLNYKLESLLETAKNYDTEYGKFQLEQSTWAMHSRVEGMAEKKLNMQVPDAKHVQVIVLDEVVE